MRTVTASLLAALVLVVCGCNATGAIITDDTGSVVDDTGTVVDDTGDTDDTDDTDDDPVWAGSWSGNVIMVTDMMGSAPFCNGTATLELTAEGVLTGSGDCMLDGGPAAGTSFLLDLTGAVASEGALAGWVYVDDWQLFGEAPKSEFGGAAGADTLGLGWIFLIDNPMGQPMEVEGTLEATKVVE